MDSITTEVTLERRLSGPPQRDGGVEKASTEPRTLLDVEGQHGMAEPGPDPHQVGDDAGRRGGDGRETPCGLARRQVAGAAHLT